MFAQRWDTPAAGLGTHGGGVRSAKMISSSTLVGTRSGRATGFSPRGCPRGCPRGLKPAARLVGRLWVWLVLAGGCGDPLAGQPAGLFSVPLEVNGEAVGEAVIDTGGGYEVMLREPFGLAIVGTAEVLAFGGKELVQVTEQFPYSAGGTGATADFAIVGLSICDCNGLGYHFFRKTGIVLGVDFSVPVATFHATVPQGASGPGDEEECEDHLCTHRVTLPFEPPPPFLANLDSAFIEVEVAAGGETATVLGLLDTGAAVTMMRRGLLGGQRSSLPYPAPLNPNRLEVTIEHPRLGTVAALVGLFDTQGLPDVILGTDVMRAWGERWYFSFAPNAGAVTVVSLRSSQSAPGLGTETLKDDPLLGSELTSMEPPITCRIP